MLGVSIPARIRLRQRDQDPRLSTMRPKSSPQAVPKSQSTVCRLTGAGAAEESHHGTTASISLTSPATEGPVVLDRRIGLIVQGSRVACTDPSAGWRRACSCERSARGGWRVQQALPRGADSRVGHREVPRPLLTSSELRHSPSMVAPSSLMEPTNRWRKSSGEKSAFVRSNVQEPPSNVIW